MPTKPSERELYVGYLGLPRRHLNFLRVAVPFTLLLVLSLSAAIVLRTQPAGEAVWDVHERTWTGVLQLEPYPVLFTDPDEDGHTAWLVVEMSKRGAHERLAAFDGQAVQITGFRLRRDARTMIELVPNDPSTPEDTAVVEIHTLVALSDPPSQEYLGAITLRGEIVDGKCYLGAMRPGDGFSHKACATLCLRGGLPPMLVTRNPDGSSRMLLLRIDGRAEIPESLFARVAEPVEITGNLIRYGSLEILETVSDLIVPR